MIHMSLWHVFKSDDLSTYPKVNSSMQVKYVDGSLALGYTFDFFSSLETVRESPVIGWRYVKDYSSE
jgi:hypothetical protein